MSLNLLSRKVTIEDLYALHKAGLMDETAYDQARELMGFPLKIEQWRGFLKKILLFAGMAFLLSGIVFFFAYNWNNLHKFVKLAMVQVGIIAGILFAIRRGMDTLYGKVAILASSVLVGVFLAVFGQIYQTGADAYQLFLGWFLITLLWVIISKFPPLILISIIVGNLALVLYWVQIVEPSPSHMYSLLNVIVGAGNFALLLLLELLFYRKVEWLQVRWIHRILALFLQIHVTWALILYIYSPMKWVQLQPHVLIALLFLAIHAWTFIFNVRKTYDIVIITISMGSIITTITAFTFKHLMGDIFSVGGLFFSFILITAQVAFAVHHLRNIHRQHHLNESVSAEGEESNA